MAEPRLKAAHFSSSRVSRAQMLDVDNGRRISPTKCTKPRLRNRIGTIWGTAVGQII